jgi:hypothetical protein
VHKTADLPTTAQYNSTPPDIVFAEKASHSLDGLVLTGPVRQHVHEICIELGHGRCELFHALQWREGQWREGQQWRHTLVRFHVTGARAGEVSVALLTCKEDRYKETEMDEGIT